MPEQIRFIKLFRKHRRLHSVEAALDRQINGRYYYVRLIFPLTDNSRWTRRCADIMGFERVKKRDKEISLPWRKWFGLNKVPIRNYN